MNFNRSNNIDAVKQNKKWDIVIIGGGATGLGCALDAASRGLTVLLIEKFDFGKGTSSKSTKLFHGGVRYLAQGNIKLVYEALKERETLLKNAPHISHVQSFIIPSYMPWGKFYYGIGLKLYDWMSHVYSLGGSRLVNRKTVTTYLPNIKTKNLNGGVKYFDGQFDDTRYCINLAQTAAQYGAVMLNYFSATEFIKENSKITGLVIKDELTNEQYQIQTNVVINATGVFADDVLKLDDKKHESIIKPSQGVHIIVDKKFLPSSHALMIPKTKDGRVLFGVPWKDKLIIGTTDTGLDEIKDEPTALPQEIEFILEHARMYMDDAPREEDVLSVFAGLRPLIKKKDVKTTSELSRDHFLLLSKSGLVTITGGKWTTYRKMAEDTINKIVELNMVTKPKECFTKSIKLHGADGVSVEEMSSTYLGSDNTIITNYILKDVQLARKIHKDLPYNYAAILLAINNEMAQTVEDVLCRRTRSILLNAKAAIECAPQVAQFMAEKMNKNIEWQQQQIEKFYTLAKNYKV